jgi:hypothetical protein
MAELAPDLNAVILAMQNGFSNFYNIIVSAYKQEQANGGHPDVEGLKALAKEFSTTLTFLARNSNLTRELPNGKVVPHLNKYELTSEEVSLIIDRLRTMFMQLIEKAQSYVL